MKDVTPQAGGQSALRSVDVGRLLTIDDSEDWGGGLALRRDGIFRRDFDVDRDAWRMLSADERAAIGQPGELLLAMPCTIDDLERFVSAAGLADGYIERRLRLFRVLCCAAQRVEGHGAASAGDSVDATANARADLARAGAYARHAENRALKREAFAWLDLNRVKFPSMDKAAEALAGKIVPVAWRTARDWVAEWHKLKAVRSASRAQVLPVAGLSGFSQRKDHGLCNYP